MPNSSLKFDILAIVRDFLFVEETDFYPDEIWSDFEEAFYLFLTDDEIEVLNYRYGSEDFCPFSVEKRRRILSDLVLRFNRSEFFSEMDSMLKTHESAVFEISGGLKSVDTDGGSEGFVRKSLNNLGLDYRPKSVGNCDFDAFIGEFPVYVWRFNQVDMPHSVLENLLRNAAAEGFGRFFIVAHPKLTQELPASIEGAIPYSFIPLIDESSAQNLTNPLNQPLPM